MEHNQQLKKIIVAIRGKEGSRPHWQGVGISGMKNGKQWFKLNMVPMGWDGYAMIVDMDRARTGHDKAESATEAAQEAEPMEESPAQFGGEEGPGF